MPRRRSASPRSSGPVRRSSPPARAAPPPPTSTPMPPQQRQPGLLGQMAATAGGVAIGSAVGHAVGNMFTGGSRSEEIAPQQQAASAMDEKPQQQPCEFEWRQFVECTQGQKDVSLCQGFNEIFKDCKTRYGQGQ